MHFQKLLCLISGEQESFLYTGWHFDIFITPLKFLCVLNPMHCILLYIIYNVHSTKIHWNISLNIILFYDSTDQIYIMFI